ncbi:GntR family transcriptional regulator [Rhodococcus sp. SRB_17]|uniref:GntR family transcriptional regulator n=1 Tax=Rhodococcus sp. OK302 TaxID=1882769 RepID=UPI000B93CDDE|nr:GntR family transcriptional regulator [Rhodococcus sp. OK302]NMM89135.1 GntR family transcriptional regulator [Rhodococcus sp. SRB_17]OYD66974.1 GntR family transcriptional regulator [Rhodococcus sp. OK302]
MTSLNPPKEDAHAALAAHRGQLERTSRTVRVAGILRELIIDGSFRPGARLSEPDICTALDVSRNTVREAFQILIEDRLVSHELNRGVFVRVPSIEDVAELYICRRVVESAGVRDFDPATGDLTALADALELAEERLAAQDWTAVGTADIHFHRAIAGLNNSSRIDQLMGGVWNELRLVFHVMDDPHRFHSPYLARNHEIYGALKSGENALAVELLQKYLDDARIQILAAYPTLSRSAGSTVAT